MNFMDFIGLVAITLPFVLACDALRLCRRFGSDRIGWPLFCAFAILAVIQALLSDNPLSAVIGRGSLTVVAYALVSIFLLLGLRHAESLVKRLQQEEQSAQLARSELESQVHKQTEQLREANEELQRTAAQLQAEIAEREWQKARAEKTHKEMLEISRMAGMSEVATSVLHNVGNVLNSVNVSAALVADHVDAFQIKNIARVAALMKDHAADLGTFMTTDFKGRQLPEYLATLAVHLQGEQSLILKEVGFVRTRIDHIKEIVATQQSYGKVVALVEIVRMDELVEDVLRIQAVELTEHRVRVRRDYASQLPSIAVDKHKVLQILLNLISNAKHACIESIQSRKEVTVRVAVCEDRVRVTVSDNGVGIPAANLRTIFNHGFTTRKKGGHGFGLHGSALAAKELGGSLAVHSDGPGHGATFTLEIPLKESRKPSISTHENLK
jgi:C4-dicarboxylate-specific signal transduction histidine kinase